MEVVPLKYTFGPSLSLSGIYLEMLYFSSLFLTSPASFLHLLILYHNNTSSSSTHCSSSYLPHTPTYFPNYTMSDEEGVSRFLFPPPFPSLASSLIYFSVITPKESAVGIMSSEAIADPQNVVSDYDVSHPQWLTILIPVVGR